MSVVFLNTLYFPDQEERKRLQLIQDKLHFSLIELKFATKSESRYQQALAKMRYHQGFRDRLKLIHGQAQLNDVSCTGKS